MNPKGFGKNYFTFGAVLAYSVQNKLQSQISSVSSLFSSSTSFEDEELDENDPPIDILESLTTINSKPCYCNCFFKLKTKITLLINHYIPRCPYYTTYFAFRRTGVHPPIS
ncbi:MAG: hypothetical protein COB17_04480 [Sulfurimonas sp.]|nr:MAG: hypothetical protein COB17_04480 [Sulfurimonas sp.]